MAQVETVLWSLVVLSFSFGMREIVTGFVVQYKRTCDSVWSEVTYNHTHARARARSTHTHIRNKNAHEHTHHTRTMVRQVAAKRVKSAAGFSALSDALWLAVAADRTDDTMAACAADGLRGTDGRFRLQVGLSFLSVISRCKPTATQHAAVANPQQHTC